MVLLFVLGCAETPPPPPKPAEPLAVERCFVTWKRPSLAENARRLGAALVAEDRAAAAGDWTPPADERAALARRADLDLEAWRVDGPGDCPGEVTSAGGATDDLLKARAGWRMVGAVSPEPGALLLYYER